MNAHINCEESYEAGPPAKTTCEPGLVKEALHLLETNIPGLKDRDYRNAIERAIIKLPHVISVTLLGDKNIAYTYVAIKDGMALKLKETIQAVADLKNGGIDVRTIPFFLFFILSIIRKMVNGTLLL